MSLANRRIRHGKIEKLMPFARKRQCLKCRSIPTPLSNRRHQMYHENGNIMTQRLEGPVVVLFRQSYKTWPLLSFTFVQSKLLHSSPSTKEERSWDPIRLCSYWPTTKDLSNIYRIHHGKWVRGAASPKNLSVFLVDQVS
jgi:hypothetical protein